MKFPTPTRFSFAKTSPLLASALVVVLIGSAVAWLRPGAGMPLIGSVQSGSSSEFIKVAPDSVLRFTFPDAIEKASAQEHLVVPEGLEGTTDWDGDTLVFKPAAPLKTGARYAFTLREGAMRSDGRPTTKELAFVFSVDGPPKAVSKLPAPDSVGIPAEAKVIMVFDRPMVPLVAVYEQSDIQLAQWNAVLEPSVEGAWQWLGTSTVEFLPKDGFVPATKYVVTVPGDFANPAGDSFGEDITWSFETVRPRVVQSVPSIGDAQSGPDSIITLTFNQPMSIDRLSSSLSFKTAEGADADVSLSHGKNEDGTKNTSTVIVTPRQPLSFATEYVLGIAQGALAERGDLGMTDAYELRFSTVQPLKVEYAHTQDYGVGFQFNNALDPKQDAKKFIRITPEPEGWDEFEITVDEWSNNWLNVYPDLKPSTEYVFTVKAGIADVHGQKMAEDYSVTIVTPEREPRVFIHSKGEFGIFEKDKPPVYYLNAINVSALNVDFAPLTLKDFLSMRRSQRYDYEFAPNLTAYEGARHWDITHPKAEMHNQWKSYAFDLIEELGAPPAPGLYALTLQAPEYRDWQGKQVIERQYFALTDMAVTLKYSGNAAFVWVTDVVTGDPVKGAAIDFRSVNGESVLTGVTDDEGVFETEIDLKKFKADGNDYDPEFWVTASKDGDMAFVGSNWSEGIRPYDFEYGEDFRYPDDADFRSFVHVQTDRPIYRAGDTVHFKGIVRLLDDNGAYHVPLSKRTARVQILDAEAKDVFNETLPFSDYGTFAGDFTIAEEGSLGTYSMQITVLPDGDIGYQYDSHSFEVRAYRKPEYKTSVTFSKEDHYDGETAQAVIDGAYYFGGAMAGAPVRWRVMTTDFFFNRHTDGWYSFSDEDSWCWWSCERDSDLLASGEGKLDAHGKLTVSFPLSLEGKDLSQVVTLEADIEDASNQVVSNRSSIVVHKSAVYVGVSPESYGTEPGQEARIKLVTVNADGSAAASREVKIELFEREWNSIRKKGVDGEYYWENDHEDTFVSDSVIRTDENGKAFASVTLPKGGSYWVKASAKDDEGRIASAGTSMYAYSSSYFNWPRSNSDRFEIVADKPEYKVGDTAKLIAKSPYQGEGVKALVTVEREGILSSSIVPVVSNALPIEIPITEDMIPNAYVSVVVVKPRLGETFNENGLDTGTPAFKTGLTRLKVETSKKNVTIAIEPNKKKYLPREEVSVTIRTWDSDGKPIPADVSLSAVDMSVLALTGFRTPDLVAKFYSTRGLGVRTSQMLLYMLERFKPGSKGGGGGEDGERSARDTFKDTAYWNPSIRTNEGGEASLSFTLPDNLTTWQLLAIANTKESDFGAFATEIIETKNVVVRPVRPRFAVHRDEIGAAAIVHNFTDEERDFAVTLSGEGFTHLSKDTRTVTVAADGQVKVPFEIRTDALDRLTLTFKAESGDIRDEITETIPVHLFSVPQSTATSGVTEDSVEETVYAPPADRALDLTLKTTISPTVAAYLPDGLRYVSEFPYGCAEQVMSSLLPNAALAGLQGFDAFAFVPDELLKDRIEQGVQKLYATQRSDGGFGYWIGSDRSHPVLTAYVTYGLSRVKAAGYSVDLGVIDRAREYLDRELKRTRGAEDERITDADRAFILFSLAETGGTDANMTASLFEKRIDLPLFAKAFLAMALHKEDTAGGKRKAEALLGEIQNSVKVTARGAHFEEDNPLSWRGSMNTNDRTTALALMATVRIDPSNALLPRVVRHLLSVREEGHWDTTQSTSFTLIALTEYLEMTGELDADFVASVALDGTVLATETYTGENVLSEKDILIDAKDLKREALNVLKISKQGAGLLYYDVLMSYVWLADSLPAVERGMGIVRTISAFDHPAEKPFDPKAPVFVAGGTYKVTLTITVPEDRHFVGVESPLPAGFEAIDTSLATVQQNLLRKELNQEEHDSWWGWWESSFRRFTHTEFRDDRVFLFADYLPAGVYTYEYMVRATVPGTFHERPARAWEMYFPEIFGQTAGGKVTVVDAR